MVCCEDAVWCLMLTWVQWGCAGGGTDLLVLVLAMGPLPGWGHVPNLLSPSLSADTASRDGYSSGFS